MGSTQAVPGCEAALGLVGEATICPLRLWGSLEVLAAGDAGVQSGWAAD